MDQRSKSGAVQGCSEAGHLYLYLYLFGSKLCIRGRARFSLGRTFVFVFVFVWIKDLYQGLDKVAPWAGHGSCDLIKGRFPLKKPGKSKILRDASGEFSDRTEIHLI